MGVVISNDFKVSIEGGVGIPFYTELFLQAVSNKFLDIDTMGFEWEEGVEEIPLVVSTHFFNLYNHGFAPSQGLPSLPKSALKKKSFILSIRGSEGRKKYRCRIFGYSDRINSILVPMSFLKFANFKYERSESSEISMAILEVEDTGDSRLKSFLNKHDYSVNKERLSGDTTALVLKVSVSILLVLAGLIIVLSLMQILSFSKILIVENRSEIRVFRILGYSKHRIGNSLYRLYVKMILTSLIAIIPAVLIALYLLQTALVKFNFEVVFMSVSTLVLMLMLEAFLFLIIRGSIFKHLKKEESIEK